jgi:putative membrane protein (TIGR04086 family)
MGLVWSPNEKRFVRPETSKPEVGASIYHAQREFGSAKENHGLQNEIGVADGEAAAATLKGQDRWKESIKRLTPKESVFRRGISIWDNLNSSKTDSRMGTQDNDTTSFEYPESRSKKLALPSWTRSNRNRKKRLRFSPSRWMSSKGAGNRFGRLRQADWSIFKGVSWSAVAWGWVVALAITIAVLGGAAIYVALTPGSVYYLSTYLLLNKVASPLLGGLVTGWRVNRKGWQAGLWVGLGYGLAIMVFRMYGGLLSAFWFEAATGLAASILAGMVGGSLGRGIAPEPRVARAA